MSPVWEFPPVRPAAVAGAFYPGDGEELSAEVDGFLAAARARSGEGVVRPAPVALVVPHAGYVYSGPVAAWAYDWLRERPFRRVAVLGPSHFVPLAGMAVPSVSSFATPIGEVPVEADTCSSLAQHHDGVTVDDEPHRQEHSIEVQLPFLQRVLDDGWTCVPIAVGRTEPEQVADVLDTLCFGGDLLPVVSTDLSHYLDLVSAQERDRHTAQAVVDRDVAAIGDRDACGVFGLRGLLHWAVRHDLDVRLLRLGTSADAGAGPTRVVGYGAFGVFASTES